MKLIIFFITLSFLLFSIGCETSISTEDKIKQISVNDAYKQVNQADLQFIDVRSEAEFSDGHAVKVVNFPLDKIEPDFAKLDKSKPVYLICQSGRRSQKAAEILEQKGFNELYNVTGGTSAWVSANLPTEK
jgi:rhodanese-related sulfurtransferase